MFLGLLVTPFAFFQVVFKVYLRTPELGKSAFGKRPEVLNSVDMNAIAIREGFGMVNSFVFVISNINQPIISSPFICVNYGTRINLAPYDRLKGFLATIWNNLGVNSTISLKDAKDRLFVCTTATFARDTS